MFVFGDATHAIAAARVAHEELGFDVVGLGTYSRELAKDVREAAKAYGIEALITDDHLEVEAKVAELQPELVLGTQMERHIAKRLGIACAVISAPMHVQDFPARYSPQMGFEGANVLFDTFVHPLMMGLEEHLLGMFRGDFEFHDDAAPSHLGAVQERGAERVPPPNRCRPPRPRRRLGPPKPRRSCRKSPSSSEARRAATPSASLRSGIWRSSRSRPCTMPKRISAADRASNGAAGRVQAIPVRVVIVTMDSHISGAIERACRLLAPEMPGLVLTIHAAAEWGNDPAALDRCRADIARGDIILAAMLFLEDHFKPVLDALQARRDQCDAMVGALSAGEVIRLTRMGRFSMDGTQGGPLAFLKRLRGGKGGDKATAGSRQMKMLRRLPQILRFIPGTAQDVRAYFLTMQYWLAGSDENVASLVRFLIDRYAQGPRAALRGVAKAAAPVEYPEVGVYHPRMAGRMADNALALPGGDSERTVGLLLMRSYLLAGNTGHYDGVIAALEAQGLRVIPAFATGLDARPAVERFFLRDGRPVVEAVVSLTGFSLVGGPAYNDAKAAETMLAALDVPYLAVTPVEFQTLEQWEASERGLLPVEATMMVAIPELDGATGSMVFGGRTSGASSDGMPRHAGARRARPDAGGAGPEPGPPAAHGAG